MASGFRQFVVHAKVTVLCIVFVTVAVIVFMNRNYKTNFWPGASAVEVSTLWLMGATSVISILSFWLLTKTRRVWAEWVELRKERELADRLAEQEKLKQTLDERERRIDDKLLRALGDENSQP